MGQNTGCPVFCGAKGGCRGRGAAFLRQNLAIFIKKTHIDKIKIVENVKAAPTPRPARKKVMYI
ncbi:hypothetical protein DW748_18900 [Ruminococcus sp. AM28-41]|nr:hypothetical protein DW748_18900 [Ruminococcus sp. AM28-41]